LLLVFVYLLPALAIFPRWALQPKLAALLPITSSGIIFLLVSILQALDIYQTNTIVVVSLLLACIVGIRVRQAVIKYPNLWSLTYIKIYALHIFLLLPFFTKLSTHSFDRGDEIYSWNFWAVQHYLSLPIDFSHTGAAYPQLLPKLLSYCYQLLGDLQLQLPVKGLLILFSLSMLITIACSVATLKNMRNLFFYILGSIFVLFICDLSLFFDDGYADPLMSCGLVLSIWALWHFYRWVQVCQRHATSKNERRALFYLSLSIVLGSCAFLSKQPALLWVIVLCVLACYSLWQYKAASNTFKSAVVINVMTLLAVVVWWFLTEGATFHQNQGVIILSFEGRSIFAQLWHSIQTYLIKKPMLFILFILAYASCRNDIFFSKVWWLFFLPSLLLWFILGAYQLRLGQHLIALAWFMIVATQFSLLKKLYNSKLNNLCHYVSHYQKVLTYAFMTVTISISALLWYKIAYIEQKNISFYQGGRLSLSRYFGLDSDWIYENIYQKPEVKLWVPSRYLYGLFYTRNQLFSPDYSSGTYYTEDTLVKDLSQSQPDYVFVVSEAIIDGPASGVLKQVVQKYPFAFEMVANSPNRFDFITYKLNLAELNK